MVPGGLQLSGVLPATRVPVRVTVPSWLTMPPPDPDVELPVILLPLGGQLSAAAGGRDSEAGVGDAAAGTWGAGAASSGQSGHRFKSGPPRPQVRGPFLIMR